jgi:hypothetical protein
LFSSLNILFVLFFQAHFLGPNIFRGRVEQYHPKFLVLLDSALEEPEAGAFFAGPAGHGASSAPMAIDVGSEWLDGIVV